jgi:formylglycine-generating enzyme required for sulfatase activity
VSALLPVRGAEVTLALGPGWNLVSVPVVPAAPAPVDVFGDAVLLPVWEWTGGAYGPAAAIRPGVAYWVYRGDATVTEIAVTGRYPRSGVGVLSSGWNAVGVVGEPSLTPLAFPLVGLSGRSAPSFCWLYDRGAYRRSSWLDAGLGGWAYFAEAGSVLLSPNPEFGGVRLLTSPGDGRIVVQWDAATDDRTDAGDLLYRIYAAPAEARTELFLPQNLVDTVQGETQGEISGLTPGQAQVVGVLCEDADGLTNWHHRDSGICTVPVSGVTSAGTGVDLEAAGIEVLWVAGDGSEMVVDQAQGLAVDTVIVFDSETGPGIRRIVSMAPEETGVRLVLADASLADLALGGVLSACTALRQGGTGVEAFADGVQLSYDLDAQASLSTTCAPQPARQQERLSCNVAGSLSGTVTLDIPGAASVTDTRQLLSTSHAENYMLNGVPVRQESGLDVSVTVVADVAEGVAGSFTQAVGAVLADTLTCMDDGQWTFQPGSTAQPDVQFALSGCADIGAGVSLSVSVWTRFYSSPVARTSLEVSTDLTGVADAGDPSRFSAFDVSSRAASRGVGDAGVLCGSACPLWESEEQAVFEQEAYALPEVIFTSSPDVLYPAVGATFAVSVDGGTGSQVDLDSASWSVVETDPGSADAVLTVAPDALSAEVDIGGAGAWDVVFSVPATGPLGTAGTRVARASFVAPAVSGLTAVPDAPQVSPGSYVDFVFAVSYDDGHEALLADGVTLSAPASASVVVSGQRISVPAGAPPGLVVLSAELGGVSQDVPLGIVSEPAGGYAVIDLSSGSDSTLYPVTYLADVSYPVPEEYRTTGILLRRLPAGTFFMGSPPEELGRESDETLHDVTLSGDFYIGVFEITQAQWELVMGDNPAYFIGDSRPVDTVSFEDIRGASGGGRDVSAASFIGRLRARSGLTGLDLPSEAQWEYACRAGTQSALNSGEDLDSTTEAQALNPLGRYWYNGGNLYFIDPDLGAHAPAGSYRPNAWGIYDMHGNVTEWCLDWYGTYTGDAVDPTGPADGTLHVIRGGSWGDPARSCRSATRWADSPDSRADEVGLRIVFPAP